LLVGDTSHVASKWTKIWRERINCSGNYNHAAAWWELDNISIQSLLHKLLSSLFLTRSGKVRPLLCNVNDNTSIPPVQCINPLFLSSSSAQNMSSLKSPTMSWHILRQKVYEGSSIKYFKKV
jgi:hypothetical protein